MTVSSGASAAARRAHVAQVSLHLVDLVVLPVHCSATETRVVSLQLQ